MATVLNFEQTMEKYREHCKVIILGSKSNASHRFMYIQDYAEKLRLETKEPPKSLVTITNEGKSNFTDQIKSCQEDAAKAQQAVKAENDLVEFRAKMEERKVKAKKAADDAIEFTFNRLKKHGEEHPEDQKMVLATTDAFTDLVAQVWGELAKVFDILIKFVFDVINKAVAWIKDNFEAVAKTVINFVLFRASGMVVLA